MDIALGEDIAVAVVMVVVFVTTRDDALSAVIVDVARVFLTSFFDAAWIDF